MAEKKCNNCGEKKPSSVPYSVLELREETFSKTFKKMWIALIIAWLPVLLVVGIFTYERLQYDYVGETTTETITVDQNAKDGGNANYIGNNGEINNGEANSN